MSFEIYCAHPISGLTYDEVVSYYEGVKKELESYGYKVLHPMTGKKCLRTDVTERFKPANYREEVATNHAILTRDSWMVRQCNVLYLDLTGAKMISIGCVMELAMAYILGKYTVVVMEDGNIHNHAFVVEAASIVFKNSEKALDYLKVLKEQTI